MTDPDLLNEPAPPPAVPVRRWRRLRWVGLLLLLLFAACGGFYGYLVYRADQDLDEAVAEVDRLEPDGWQLADIEARRKVVADEDNAALVVQAIKAKLPTPWPPPRLGLAAGAVPTIQIETDLDNLPPEVQIDEFLLADLRASFSPQAAGPALDEARKLPALRDGRFPLQWSKDFVSTPVASQDARAAIKVLRLEAALLAQDGKIDSALEMTRGILVAGRAVGDEPMTVSLLIRIACSTQAVFTLERVLAQGEPSAGELAKIQELLQAEAAEPLLLTSARGERAGLHELMKAVKSGEVNLTSVMGAPGGGNAFVDMAAPVLARGSHGRLLRLLTEYVEIAKLPPERQAEPLKALEQKAKQAKADYDLVIGLLMPSMLKVGEAYRRDQAYLRCAGVAVAAERYRRQHRRWPATLAELAPDYLKAVPTDPYDGQPLRYRRLADGVIVYSVGPDLQDDGGARNRINPLAKGTDLGFRLWDADRRRQPPAEVLPPPD